MQKFFLAGKKSIGDHNKIMQMDLNIPMPFLPIYMDLYIFLLIITYLIIKELNGEKIREI